MLVQIVGAGIVGQATGKGLERYGHTVFYEDISQEIKEKLVNAGKYVGRAGERPDVVFFCVPEKKILEVIEEWSVGYPNPAEPLFVIRSTVPPGTNVNITNKTHRHICSNPEFLREAVSDYDFCNAPSIVIGACCLEHEGLLERLWQPLRRPMYFTDPSSAEMVKMTMNCYLATQISFWNQIKVICEGLGLNSHDIGALCNVADPRVSKYGSRMHGDPYGGRCLPKDIDQLLAVCDELQVSSILLSAVKVINKQMENVT